MNSRRMSRDSAMEIELIRSSKGDPLVRRYMAEHYSKPKGFVGRQLVYLIRCGGATYGAIAGGSATLQLERSGRVIPAGASMHNVVNNNFFHLDRGGLKYPVRNFAQRVLSLWRKRVMVDWPGTYKHDVRLFETLVEPPRTGDVYLRDGWSLVGMTAGYQVKRVSGHSPNETFKGGVRVWDRVNLRPKHVFTRLP